MKTLMLCMVGLLISLSARSQILKPLKWSYAAKRISPTEAVLFFKADLDEGWHLYGLTASGGGPVKTTFTFNAGKAYAMLGDVTAPQPETRFEPAFNTKVNYYEKSVVFQQRIKLSENKVEVKGTIEYMVCSNRQCLPPETIEFTIPVN